MIDSSSLNDLTDNQYHIWNCGLSFLNCQTLANAEVAAIFKEIIAPVRW
jgi:hypothetical protein